MQFNSLFRKSSKIGAISMLSLGLIAGNISPVLAVESEGLIVTNSTVHTPEEVVASLLGGDVTVSNVKFTGSESALGSFSGGEGIIGFDKGIVLSTGHVEELVGPNTFDDNTGIHNTLGDQDLNTLIPGYETFDASVLEFDFVSNTGIISFNYVFSSEEFSEYVGSRYNDVFGFFVNGENIALIPNTTTPVSINNVNGGNLKWGNEPSNPEYYVGNELIQGAPLNTEMDGMTVVLQAVAKVEKGQTNHIKLAIGDAGDYNYDSNVLIQAGSFTDDASKLEAPLEESDTTTPSDEEEVSVVEPPQEDIVLPPTPNEEDTSNEQVPEEEVIAPSEPEILLFDKFTGGGKVLTNDNSGTNRNVGFNVKNTKNGVDVNLEYNENIKGKSVKDNSSIQVHINGYASNVHQVKNSDGEVIGIEFDANAILRVLKPNNERANVKVHVSLVDNGKGSKDEFRITILDSETNQVMYSIENGMVQGNIQAH